MWGLDSLGARADAAKSFAANWNTVAVPRTDTPVNISEPNALPNLEDQPLNPNQLALVGFSRFLETKNVTMAARQGPVAEQAMTLQVGKRLVWSIEEDRHGEAAAQRVDQFLALARENTTPPARITGAAAKSAKKAAKTTFKKAARKAAKKAPAKAAKIATRVAKKSLKKAAKKATKKGAKKVANKPAKKRLRG
jgi:hypothetical protein